MAYRAVTHLTHSEDGEIILLCNHREIWSPRMKEDAIDDIESGRHTYYYLNDHAGDQDIIVTPHPEKGKILQAVPQGHGRSGSGRG